MKRMFVVCRSSGSLFDEPCKEAEQKVLKSWDRRTSSVDRLPGGKASFESEGTHHGYTGTSCTRLVTRSAFVCRGSILDFIKKYGRCVVHPPGTRIEWDPPRWEVEIYDHWREL